MQQFEDASNFFARDAWVHSFEGSHNTHSLILTLCNRNLQRQGCFVKPIVVQLLVPTNNGFPYMWFTSSNESYNSSSECTHTRALDQLIEVENHSLSDKTISSIGLVAVVSSFLMQVRTHAKKLWLTLASSTNETYPCEWTRRQVDVSIIAGNIRTNLNGSKMMLILMQLAASSADFERLCVPFPEVFRDPDSGKQNIARLRQALLDLPCISDIPDIVTQYWETNSTTSDVTSGLQEQARQLNKRANGALSKNTTLILFWIFVYGPFELRYTNGFDKRKDGDYGNVNCQDGLHIFDVISHSKSSNFSREVQKHGEIKVVCFGFFAFLLKMAIC